MRLLAAVVLAVLVASFSRPASAEDFVPTMTLNDLVEPTRIVAMTLSPDGKRLAGLTSGASQAVFVLGVDEPHEQRVIARPEADSRFVHGSWPVAVHWINDDLLAVDLSSRESISVDTTGKKIATLGERFIRPMPDKGRQGDSVLVYRDIDDRELDLVNARTGARTRYRVSLPGKLTRWAFDATGALRAVTMSDTAFWSAKTKITQWYRSSEQADWQLLEEAPITERFWFPLHVLPQPDSLAVLSRRDRDTYAVFRYDTGRRELMELMAGHPDEDIVDVSGLEGTYVRRVTTDGIKPKTFWFDARWAGLQASVDAALPDRINVLEGDPNGRVLVLSYSDVDPGRWWVLDTRSTRMWEVGRTRQRIDPARMRPMETIRYAARDGLTIHAYVTRPARPGAGPAPMVVVIHGGPQVRDRWQWDAEAQLLAGQGYVVFQPQFRGSAGFGRRFEEAGYAQWGRAMQDDITDGVGHLVAQKIADPARICIYGGSYGGYAALWGVIKTPELYRCGISFAGISDLTEMASHSFRDDSTAASREISRVRIGDAERDRAMLDEVSPIRHVAQVRVPLLIAHGDEDRRVLPGQSRSMVRALRELGKPVEWMPFPDAGHAFVFARDEFKFRAAVLDFLKRHLGETRGTSSDTVRASTGATAAEAR